MSGSQRSSAPAVAKRQAQAGFSLAELIVSLFVVVLLLVIILTLFDSTSKLARAQTYVADLQQSVRVAQDEMVRYTRMAARGGLGRGNLPNNMVSVSVRDNVKDGSADQYIAKGDVAAPRVLPDTDVLTVRGVFGSIYHVNSDPGAGTLTFDDVDNPTSGKIVVQNPVPSTGVAQSLQPLIGIVQKKRPDALLIASPLGGTLYHVVQLDPDQSDVANPSRIVLAFVVINGSHTADYNSISPNAAFPAELRSAAYVGIVEEYRYYVRQILSDPLNPASDATSRLSRARFYPGSEAKYANDDPADNAPLKVDVADDILDLQVALAVDGNGDNTIIAETGDENDEWLYNSDKDAQKVTDDIAGDPTKWNGPTRRLFYVRINTLARTARRDPYYVSAPLQKIEDHPYNEPAATDAAFDAKQVALRQHRRRLLQTVVDLRNL